MNTTVPNDVPDLNGLSRGGLPRIFARKDWLVRLSVCQALLANAVAVACLILFWRSQREPQQFIALDGAGNVSLVVGRPFAESAELHAQQALLATSALFLRGAREFDLPEILESMFTGDAFDQARRLRDLEGPEFQLKQIQQKPQVLRIDATETRPDQVMITAAGRLLRVGLVQEHPVAEIVPFKLELTLKPNRDLLRNRRQPTQVVDFHVSYENPR